MPSQEELAEAINELSIRGNAVWLATRLRSDSEDERRSWPTRVNVHIKFYRAFAEAGCREGVLIELASHGRSGWAVPRFVRSRSFLEWDIEAEATSSDGVWTAFTIFALIPDAMAPRLWCWICETIEEEEYAESVFAWWEPQAYAYARGLPLFPQRIQ